MVPTGSPRPRRRVGRPRGHRRRRPPRGCGSTGASGAAGSPSAAPSATVPVAPSSPAPRPAPRSASAAAVAPFDPAGLRVDPGAGRDRASTPRSRSSTPTTASAGCSSPSRAAGSGSSATGRSSRRRSSTSAPDRERRRARPARPRVPSGLPRRPRLFVDYTDTNGDTQVSSFTGDPATPDRRRPGVGARRSSTSSSPSRTTTAARSSSGRTACSTSSLGDGGSGGDPQGNGQKLETLLGKILRIDVDSRSGDRALRASRRTTRSPTAAAARREIWLTGLRNPWRMQLRSGDRRPVDRRRRPGRVGGDRRPARRRAGRDELRLEPDGGPPLLPAVVGLRQTRPRRCRSPSTATTRAAR